VERFDIAVVGAGPAGSLTAYRLARAGARVLLVDRARFPRDKPCGGGLTGRALRELPFDVAPVVEDRATRILLRARYKGGYERASDEPLVALTQRRRLDAFLADKAATAGADFRDGVRVSAVEQTDTGATLTVDGTSVRARTLVGADGANGMVAKASGLGRSIVHGVALEGNLPYSWVGSERFAGRLVLEFGVVPGGYAWLFPKGDHVNVGVGGWQPEGPRLRDHLRRLCAAHGLPIDRVESLRGHRLPMRLPTARLAGDRTLLVGDAAGLVDPFSGDGLYEALLSARVAADTLGDVLAGRAASAGGYQRRLADELGGLPAFSWRLKSAVDRYPRLALTIVRLPPVWPVVEAVVRGDLKHPGLADGAARIPVRALRALAGRARPAHVPAA
jgi:geranylgeranyl reductase family protein